MSKVNQELFQGSELERQQETETSPDYPEETEGFIDWMKSVNDNFEKEFPILGENGE